MNPKAKGSAYERNICKRLSLWVSGMTRKDIFWRSAMSGGRATVARRKGDRDDTAGDICSTCKEGHVFTDLFVAETKHYKDLELEKFFFLTKSPVVDFWEKVLSECTHGRVPMLIALQNRREELVFTTETGIRVLRAGGRIKPHLIVPDLDLHVVRFRDILCLKFDGIRGLHKLRALRKGD